MTLNSINSINKRSPSLGVLAVFYTALLGGLIILGILFYHNNQAFNNGAALVTHTRTVLGRTDSVLLLSQNLQWEARNYTLAGDLNAYQKYFFVRESLQTNAKYLPQLVKDDKYQHANAIRLQQQIAHLIQFTDSSLQLRQASGNILNGFDWKWSL
jgi:CHASE3 domain sensor protein